MEGTQLPALEIADKWHILNHLDDVVMRNQLKQDIWNNIRSNDMSAIYESLVRATILPLDQNLLDTMQLNIRKKLHEFDQMISVAKRDSNERKFYQASIKKFEYLIRIFHWGHIINQGNAILKLVPSDEARKLEWLDETADFWFLSLQYRFFYLDLNLIKKILQHLNKLLDKGVPVELLKLKNRLKVYEGLFYMCTKDFNKAAQLFLEAIPSPFNCCELFSVMTFYFYTVLTSILSSSYRVRLQQTVLSFPNIHLVTGQIRFLFELLILLNQCQYMSLFQTLVQLEKMLLMYRYVAPHTKFYLWEIRKVAYIQYIDKVPNIFVQMDIMASKFGVPPDLITLEVKDLIKEGKDDYYFDNVVGLLVKRRIQA